MSEEIEELVNNLNASLTHAIKSTLGPYVNKLNLNNERYKVVSDLLKSLPEYKNMENEILQSRNEKQALMEQFSSDVETLRGQHNSEKQFLQEQFREVMTHNAILRRENDMMRIRLEEMIEDKVDKIVDSHQAPTPEQQVVVTDNSEPNLDNKPSVVLEDKPEVVLSDKQEVVLEDKPNVELQVIEKENTLVDTDIQDKVKEIYSEAKIECVNKNISLQTVVVKKEEEKVVCVDSSKNFPFISQTDREKEIEDIVSELERHLSMEDEEEADASDEEIEEDETEASVADEVTDNEEASVAANDTECAEEEEEEAIVAANEVSSDKQSSQTEKKEENKEITSVAEASVLANKVEEAAEEEEEEELFAINIPGFKNEFYTSDELNGDIYEVNSDDSVGKLLGKFKNGKPVWNNKK